ncbi:ANKRD32_5 [Blepharisma stoltei]|uniref:Uncharacterized protein n=1 Tax=Blepharisma stoltei TaxID=1481888 RepID=A0AAU9JDS5_9CILI|nr:unnamed protein product [Blepharisma stoltei]
MQQNKVCNWRQQNKKSIFISPFKPYRFQTPSPVNQHNRLKSLPSITKTYRSSHRTPSPMIKSNILASPNDQEDSKSKSFEKSPTIKEFSVSTNINDYRLVAPRGILISYKKEAYNIVKLPNYENKEAVSSFRRVIRAMAKPKKRYFECLKLSVRHFKALKLTNKEMPLLPKLIGNEPFGRKNSIEFMKECKEGNLNAVLVHLHNDKWLAHVFDAMKMTALHWAAIRDHSFIIEALMSHNAFVDVLDMTHRTPLYLASRMGSYNAVKKLLSHRADPFIKSNSKKLPADVAKNQSISILISKAMLFHVELKKIPRKLQELEWARWGNSFFKEDLSIKH